MGYTTKFTGSFKLNRPLTLQHKEYLIKFASIRHMKRDTTKLAQISDPEREKVNLPLGTEGEFFLGGLGDFGQDREDNIIEYNAPASPQPGLWCCWEPSSDGTSIQWNESEKFYYYVEWLNYIMKKFLSPWGYELSGSVRYQGEEAGDVGAISIMDGVPKRVDYSPMI